MNTELQTSLLARNKIILELFEENMYNSREVMEELIPYVDDPDHIEVKTQRVTLQWLKGTRFFIAPASIFFELEAIREANEA